MKHSSLESVISDMVRRLDAARPDDDKYCQGGSDDPLREIEALMPVDEVLASLHKQYVEAVAQYKKLLRANGVDDPMAEIAADMLDSARSAIQTRLIELTELCEEEVHEKMRRGLLAKRAEAEIKISRELIEKRKEDKEGDLFFWFVAFYWLLNRTVIATRKTLSAANDFAIVSARREKRTSYA